MSYCRWGEDSDVYIYASSSELVCCACLLNGGTPSNHSAQDYKTRKFSEMLIHLDQHTFAGHKVPKHVKERLADEKYSRGAGDILRMPGTRGTR